MLVLKYFDNFTAIFEQEDVVPKTDKREAKEEAKYPPKFCHKVGQGVDQLFRLHLSFLRHCPKRENKAFRPLKGGRTPFPDKCVLLVSARLYTTSQLPNLARLHPIQLIIFPLMLPEIKFTELS